MSCRSYTRIATHVILSLVPLLPDDPVTLSVLIMRFCVSFTTTSGAESSKSWVRTSTGCPLTSQLMNVSVAVQCNSATPLSEMFMDAGGITIPGGGKDYINVYMSRCAAHARSNGQHTCSSHAKGIITEEVS